MGVATGLQRTDSESVSEKVEEAVDQRPWIDHVTRLGWLAKGAVYALMGATAFTIGRGKPTDDDASPEGAVAQVVDTRGGTFLLATLAVGLVLYSAWRLLSVAMIRGNTAHDWADRAGYTFSAAFYLVIAVTATLAVVHGESPEDQNTVERLSKRMLESDIGRWVLLLGGLVALGVGIYFVIQKGIKRSFCDDLDLSGTPKVERQAIEWTGMLGWISRGLITAAVGWFVIDAAWTTDGSDARGFDRAFRELATGDIGSIGVSIAGLALVVYGVFCVLSIRHLDLEKMK
jgi:hypothetical protein